MASKYIVAPGGSVQLPAGKIRRGSQRPVLLQGEQLPDGVFTPAQIKAHIKSGYVVAVDRKDLPDPASLPVASEIRPGETAGPPITSGKPGENSEGSDPVLTEQIKPQIGASGIPDVGDEGAGVTLAPATVSGPKVDASGSPVSKWIFDPATLTDKSVEELNVLIKENGPDVDPFDTVEEAVAFLSQDFVVGLSVR